MQNLVQNISYSKAYLLFCMVAFGCALPASRVEAAETWAVIGDDISVGTGVHPELRFDALNLWSLVSSSHSRLEPAGAVSHQLMDAFQLQSNLLPPARLRASNFEYRGVLNWFSSQLIFTMSRVYFDSEELTWSYFLASDSSLDAQRLWLAGHNFARAQDGIAQLDRILDRSRGRIPEKMFVFFSGYDVCSSLYEYMTSTELYKQWIDNMLRYARINGDVPDGGVDIYLVAPLNLSMLRQRESILSKVVPAFGKEVTCKELHDLWQEPWTSATSSSERQQAMAILDSVRFPKGPAAFCPTLFERNFDKQNGEQLNGIANRLRGYQNALREIADTWKHESEGWSNVRIHYLNATAKLILEGDDIANDCFHLSVAGQAKIANSIRQALSDLPVSE